MTYPTPVGRERPLARRALLALSTILASGLAAPALAQTPAEFRNYDENGVDLTLGDFKLDLLEGSIGSGDGALALTRHNASEVNPSAWDALTFARSVYNGQTSIRIGRAHGREDSFTPNGAGGFTATKQNGATLAGGGSYFEYRGSDGTLTVFGDPSGNPYGGNTNFCVHSDPPQTTGCYLLPLSITSPDGKTVELEWELHEIMLTNDFPPDMQYFWRLKRVSNSHGYSIAFSYAGEPSHGQVPPSSWYRRTGAQFYNGAVSGTAVASVAYGYPASGVVDVTDMAGQIWRVTGTSIKRPDEASPGFSVSYSGGSMLVTRQGVTTTYQRTVSGATATMAKRDALGRQTTIVSDLNIGRPTAVTDALGRTTSYQYDGARRLTRVTAPEGNYTQYTLDGRGNATETRSVAKPGSGLADIVTSASYEAGCSNPVTCNQPNSLTDARGAVTEFAYDPTHGGVTSVTAPAPTPGAPRPQTRYTYAALGGAQQVTQVSACRTTSSCAGTADETRTSYGYDANGNVTSVTSGAGDGSLSVAATATYDARGDLVGVDGPLAGPGDTTVFRYDAARRRVGMVGPDPDGAGPLLTRAERTSYNAGGDVTLVERGTVEDAGDAAWGGFVPLQQVATGYDAHHRPVRQALTSGGQTYALEQSSYDAVGRIECRVTRMNPAAFGSAPGACSLGAQGSDGPDRITRASYDELGRVVLVQSAYGTAEQSDEAAASYTPNGRLRTAKDANGNLTTYDHDGFDRLKRTYYPVQTVGAHASNGGDYEELGYDANGNVVSRRLRDGQVIGYVYDALNRLTLKDVPNGVIHEYDVSYQYDNLGRLTRATDAATHFSAFGYDALGRKTSEQSNWTTRGWHYDAAGRPWRTTWGDGFYVDYRYLVTGEMAEINEQGGFSLARFDYDNLGRRTTLSRGNGTVTSYGYDAASRLTSLAQDLGGSAHDLSLTFGHNAAGQIASRTSSNDAYAWTGHGNTDRGYGVNGLNQATSAGTTALGYDGRGNLTQSGATAYGYTSENRLATAQGYVRTYDPLGRFHWISNAAGHTWMQYDGDRLIEEIYNHAPARRYVHGPGADEPLVWYEGAGTGDRRWLHADERGSIVAVTNGSGATIAINTYDEYGRPGANNLGRFQYTGQKWVPELGLYDYKARMYSPQLGRFMQTDPIGYADGMNLYGYVGGDPVNRVDPSGTFVVVTGNPLGSPGSGGSRLGGSVSSIGMSLEQQISRMLEEQEQEQQTTLLPGEGPHDDQKPTIEITVTARIGHLPNVDIRIPAIGRALDRIHDALFPPACCFTAGTLVSTPSGLKPIETLKIGDLVISRNDKTGETAAKPIVGITPAHERRIWTVTVSYKGEDDRWHDERYETTDDHPWRTADGKWVASASLAQGQVIAREDGTAVVATVADTGATKLTYNLEVAEFHTYFVGKAGTWVHNDCLPQGYSYDPRVRARGLEDPKSHNFPYSADRTILSTKPIPKPNGYRMYQYPGTMNGKNGVFEIGVTKNNVINHRFFRPY